MQKSIKSFFTSKSKSSSESSGPSSKKRRVDDTNNENEHVYSENPVNIVNKSNNKENVDTGVVKPVVQQYQPDESYPFPKTSFNTQERSCQSTWFKTYSWLHYDIEKDCVFCFYCLSHESKLTAENNRDPAYISRGFKNWKKAPACFKIHEQSKCHTAALTYETIVPKCGDASEMHDNEIAKRRERERLYLKIVMESIQYLTRQGLALRGNDDGNDNLTQLLYLRSIDHPWIKERLAADKKPTPGVKKYTHRDYQEEITGLMANQLLRRKLYDINNSKMFSLMADEYTDVANKQQLSICTRWVDDNLNACEDFLGFYEVPNIKSDTLVSCIKDALIRFNLPIDYLRGQTYDGASNMMGKKSGVAQQIKSLQPKAVETHCHGHSLSLSVKDATRESRLLSDVMAYAGEIVTLVKYSPKRENMLGDIKESIEFENDYEDHDLVESLTKLCVTRWTVRGTAFKRILRNYQPLADLWEESLGESLDSDTRKRIIGCRGQMTTFRFFYGLNLGQTIYSITDNLSKTLQTEGMSATESKKNANLTVKTFEKMRSESAADLFFESVKKKASKFNFINDPVLPRRRNDPNYKRLTDYFVVERTSSGADPFYASSPIEHYRRLYFEILDTMINAIKDRFNQPSFVIFESLENVLLEAIKACESSVNSHIKMYEDEVDFDMISIEANVFRAILGHEEVNCFKDVHKVLKRISPANRELMPNIVYVVKLLLVNPATSCTPERSFSTARRMKTWLRSTMKPKRFNNLSLLHIHKELTDKLDLDEVGREFVSTREHRFNYFGQF